MPDNLAFMDATAQAELVSSGQVVPRELVDAAIERVEKLNGELNAVVTKLFEKARAAAEGELPEGRCAGCRSCSRTSARSRRVIRPPKG